jgi:hypothetical protein
MLTSFVVKRLSKLLTRKSYNQANFMIMSKNRENANFLRLNILQFFQLF